MADQTVVRVRADVSDFDRNMDRVADRLQSIGNKFAGVGKDLTKKITAPIMGIGIGAIKVGMEFEAGMSKVAAITTATSEEMEELTAQAEELGRKTQFSATQASEAMSYLGMAGMNTSEIMSTMPAMLDLAAASGTDLASTADIVSDALSAFSMEASQAGQLADIMAKASSTANTNVLMLGESFKYAAPVASAFGMSAEETTAALALMSNSGIKASQAGTSLRGALTRLAKQPKAVADALSDLNIKTADAEGNMLGFNDILGQMRTSFKDLTEEQRLSYASQIFGTEAMSGMLAVLNTTTEEFDEYTKTLENSNGTSENMANVMNDNLKGSLTRLKSALEGAGIAISKILSPAIDGAVGKINELVDKFNALDPSVQKNILAIAGIIAVIPPIIWGVGKLITLVGALQKGFIAAKGAIAGFQIASLANPIGIAIVAVTALVAAFVGLYKTNEEFRDKVHGVWEQIKDLALTVFGEIQAFWDKWGDDIIGIFQGLWSAISIIINLLVDAFNVAFPLISNVVIVAVRTIGDVLGGLLQILNGIINFIVGVFTLDWDRAWGGIRDIFGGIWGSITGIVKGAVGMITGIIDGLISSVKKAVSWVGKLFDKDKNASVSVETGTTSAAQNKVSNVADSVNWYAKGGMFNKSSIIGVGEDTGVNEAVIPMSGTHMKPFAEEIAKLMGGTSGVTLNQNIYSPSPLNPSEIKARTIEGSKQLAQEMGVI